MGLGAMVKGLAGGGNPAALGDRVYRAGLAADLTGLGTVNLFQISGGDVLLAGIYGKVTTQIGAVGATTIQLDLVPTGGASGVLCVAVAINTDVVNTIYTITGDVAVGMDVGTSIGVGHYQETNTMVLVPGIIGMIVAVSVNTGVIDWTLHYVPLDTDSKVNPL